MGVGKSTIGPRLAAALGLPFADLDDTIVEVAGVSIPALFSTQGEAAFRALETDRIRAALAAPPHVLALGGGALHQPGNLALLRDAFDVIVLDVPLSAIAARLADTTGRPLWTDDVPARFTARRPGYRAAGPNIDADAPPDVVVARILEALEP